MTDVCYIDRSKKLSRGEHPKTDEESTELVLGIFADDEELLDPASDLAAAVDAHSMDSLPVSVQPECEFLIDYVRGIPDVARLRAELALRPDRLREIVAQSDLSRTSSASDLPAPFDAQWIGLRDAVGTLFNQVQNYNAKSQAEAFERAFGL